MCYLAYRATRILSASNSARKRSRSSSLVSLTRAYWRVETVQLLPDVVSVSS